YGTLKRLDELTFQAAAASAGTTYVVPRIFNLAGAHISKTDHFALGDFVIAARAGGPVEVRSPERVLRAYVGADEVVAVSTALALRGQSAAFDTGGHLIEVGDLARLVARLHGLPASSVSRPAPQGEPADEYVGDPSRWDELIADLGLRSQTLDDLIVATARSLDNPAGSGIVPLGSDPALPAKIQESTP
ncbi:MAG: hypothetical protein QOE01_1876, partial [Actinomycetota bacterium]|nr:hypothetical protein [Actinomycetota bacterium]